MLRSGYSKEEIVSGFEKLLSDPFWGDKGVDFKILSSQIGKVKKTKLTNNKYAKYA
jgi:hypothetical protein